MLDGARIGAIGDFSADDGEATAVLLDEACDFLRERGCRMAVGPMNGSTWQAHRFVIESDGRAPFLLEPRNPPEHPGWWERAGFSVLCTPLSVAMIKMNNKTGLGNRSDLRNWTDQCSFVAGASGYSSQPHDRCST